MWLLVCQRAMDRGILEFGILFQYVSRSYTPLCIVMIAVYQDFTIFRNMLVIRRFSTMDMYLVVRSLLH